MPLTIAFARCNNVVGVPEGSEQAARDFYDVEFKKWLAGQDTAIKPIGMVTAVPISYAIQSVVPVKPDGLGTGLTGELNPGSGEWPCYKFNVGFQAKSVNTSKTSRVASCTLTWHKNDKTWCYFERY